MTDELEGERTGSKLIYGEWLLKETEDILPDTVLLPNYISPLVQQVYGKIDSSEEYQKYISDIKISESHAGSFLMDVPGNSADDTIHGLLDKTINDEHAEASVRDGISSLEVLVMRMGSDGLIRFLDGITVSQELDDDECIRIAGQKLRLPSRFSMPWNIDRNIHELEEKCRKHIGHWQKHYLLAGQLVLFLDDNLEGELEGFRLRYSYDNGLIWQNCEVRYVSVENKTEYNAQKDHAGSCRTESVSRCRGELRVRRQDPEAVAHRYSPGRAVSPCAQREGA